jgi:hypothetical protein
MRAAVALAAVTLACAKKPAAPYAIAPIAPQGAALSPPAEADVSAETKYFPDGTFDPARPNVDRFVVDWYSSALRAMREPSLLDAAPDATVYRFLWLRTWGHPIAVRIESTPTQRVLTAVRLGGHGGYAPGKQTLRRARMVSDAEWATLEARLAHAKYATLPTRSDRVGFDGAQWIVESSRHGTYKVVERWSPELDGPDAAYRAACEYFIALAGTDIVVGHVY